MTSEKMLWSILQYRGLFKTIKSCRFTNDSQPTSREELEHVGWMLDELRILLLEENPNMGKANRWLGFIQGVFFSLGTYNINQMRDHNRPSVTPPTLEKD